ncbi:MAG: InlB B-repeat-containing protein, partial [Clostridia bacterium]|nr:InlB B-repeat-containing protein [Clostridia bacterium]
ADGEVVYTNGAEYTMGTASEYTLYAVWDVVNYSITYVLNGGTNGENPGTYTIEDTITFKSPEKAGYTFDGWYEDSSFNTQKSGIEKGTTGSVTVYAKWTPITYTIAYTLNGGSASNVVNYTIETATFTLNNPTRAGYTFSGWTGTGLGGATQTVTIAKGSMGNRTYTATWTANDDTAYKVEYYLQNSDGNGYTLAATETLTGTTDTTATANVKTFEHFTYDEDESTISGTITGDGELVLTVYYTRNTYSVSTSGGNASAGGYTQIAGDYRYETSVTVSATTKAGYEFDGWYVGESRVSSNAEYTFTATENVELTPQWNVVEYAITYVLDGGTNGSNPATYTVEDTVTFVAATKNGYTFGGWYSNEACTQAYNAIAMGTTGNKTVYAKWTPITYTIAYTLNGGSATNETSYTIESEAFTLNNPTRTGYTFSGWTGTGLDEATLTVTVAQGSTGNRTYTATWMPITYTIAYTLNGGTVATANATSYNIETATFTLNNPTKEGYTFAGWTGTGLNEATVNVSIAQGSMGNRTYVATWTPIDYTITYNLNNGTASNVANYTIETATFTLNNPTRAGYTFAGWTGTGLDVATLKVSVAQGSK